MIVPKFWAEASSKHREGKKSITVRRYGWSDASQEDAQRSADERASDALSRILRGETLSRREHKVAYNGAEGLPIREEVVSNHGDTVITRNSYGALCLNTPNVLFADIDFENAFRPKFLLVRTVVSFIAAAASGVVFRSIPAAVAAGFGAATVLGVLAHVIPRLVVLMQGGIKEVVMKGARNFILSHPEWRLAIYETPAGLRLLALHRTFEPRDPVVSAFFESINADVVYRRMCLTQNCFRARLSAKPWRIGIVGHMKPRPGVWPIKPERMADRQQWIDAYDRAATSYAACRFIETIGSETVNREADAVRELHDDMSRARGNLRMA